MPMFGSRPMQPGLYDVPVQRGADWEYHDQDGGERNLGFVMVPEAAVIEEWLVGGITGTVGGVFDPTYGMYNGGWWVTRSACVQWPDGSTCYYRCGDEGYYDLDEVLMPKVVYQD